MQTVNTKSSSSPCVASTSQSLQRQETRDQESLNGETGSLIFFGQNVRMRGSPWQHVRKCPPLGTSACVGRQAQGGRHGWQMLCTLSAPPTEAESLRQVPETFNELSRWSFVSLKGKELWPRGPPCVTGLVQTDGWRRLSSSTPGTRTSWKCRIPSPSPTESESEFFRIRVLVGNWSSLFSWRYCPGQSTPVHPALPLKQWLEPSGLLSTLLCEYPHLPNNLLQPGVGGRDGAGGGEWFFRANEL